MKIKIAKDSTPSFECNHPEKGYSALGVFCCSKCYIHQLAIEYYPENFRRYAEKNENKENEMVKIKKESAAPAKPSKSKEKKEGHGGRVLGRTLKMGIAETWAHLFKEARRTDEEISKFLKAEFPGRKSKVFDAVSSVRSRYNAGALTGGTKPSKRSESLEAKAKKK